MFDATPTHNTALINSGSDFGRDEHKPSAMNNLAKNEQDHVSATRKWFANLLWRAFPSPSEHDLSLKAARALDVSPRQVRNWLRCENSAAFHYVTAVMAIAGAEVVFRKIEGGK